MDASSRLTIAPEPRRDGALLVLAPGSLLPARCMICNADAPGPTLVKKISTLSPWYPLFSSAGWNAHRADEHPIHFPFSLCFRHRLQWLARTAVLGFVSLADIELFLLCSSIPDLAPLTGAITAFPALMFLLTLTGHRSILRPRRVHHGLAWFSGAGPEFLDSLPELDERADVFPPVALCA